MRRPLRIFPALLLAALASCARKTEPPARSWDGSVEVVLPAPVESLDPQRQHEDFTRMVLACFYEGLVELDARLQLRPGLATSWSNPTETTWRLTLRPGVRFHDGQAFGAEDVRRTILRAKSLPDGKVEADVRSIVDIRSPDPLTVELTTDRPRPLLLVRLAQTPILPRSVPDATITAPIGTGPLRFVSARGTAYLVARRFDGYWGTKSASEQLVIRAVASESLRLAAARRGHAFVMPLDVPAGPGDRFRTVRHPTLTVTYLFCRIGRLVDGKPSPFADVRVRRAVDRALSRDTLVRNAFAGAAAPCPQLVGRGVHGFDPELATATPSLEEARRLLAEAGVAKGFATTLVTSERGEPAGREIARQLAAVGIRLTVTPLPWPDLYRKMGDGQAPLALASWTLSSGDASSLFEPVLHSRSGTDGFGSENTTLYQNDEVDRLIERAAVEMQPEIRTALLKKTMRLALADLPLIPVHSAYWTYGVSPEVTFEPRLDVPSLAHDIGPKPD